MAQLDARDVVNDHAGNRMIARLSLPSKAVSAGPTSLLVHVAIAFAAERPRASNTRYFADLLFETT